MINNLIRKQIKGSIQRKITIGFSILLALLAIVSFLGIRGINRLNQINDRTNSLRELLDIIYKVRLNAKNLVLYEDTSATGQIDSLTLEINNILLKTKQNQLHAKTIQILDPMVEHLAEFNKNYKIYLELISSKKELENRLDSFFYSIDNVKNSSQLSASNWAKKHPLEPIIVLNDLNNIHSNILKVRYEVKKIGLKTNFKVLIDSLSKSFDHMFEYTYVLERNVKDRVLRTKVAALRQGLRSYEQTLSRYLQLIQDMLIVVNDLRTSGRKMQDVARKAIEFQASQQAYYSHLSFRFLLVIVLMSIFGGGAIFIFFFRKIMNDEHQREQIESEIDENRRLLDDIISNSISLIYVKNLEGKYSLVNQIWLKQMNIPEGTDVTGRYDHEFFPKEIVEKWRETDLKVIQHNKPLISEEEFGEGENKRYYLSNKFPIHDKEGHSVAVCGMSTDITELKNALNELERSRENYRNIVSNVPGIVYNCKYDDSRTMIFLSSGFEKITGFSRINFIKGSQTFTNLIVPEDRAKVIDTISKAVSRNQSFEIEYRIEDAEGNVRWLHEKGMAISQNNETNIIIQGVIVDVTDQMNAIQEVMVRDRFLQGVADAVRELLIGSDTIESISKSLRIVGFSSMVDIAFIFRNEPSEGEDIRYTSHLYEWHKSSIEPVRRDDLQMIEYEKISSRLYFSLKDKNVISGNKDDFAKEEQKLFEWLGLESMLIVPVFTRDNFWGFIGFGLKERKMNWIDSHKAIFKAYAVTLGIIIAKDMDAALLKEAKESAEAATRMKSDFLARMSHEIRTPMNAILGWTHLAIEKSKDDTNIEYLKRIQSGSKSLLGIINDILDFSKIEAGKLSIEMIPFDLEKVFSDMSDMVSYRAFKKGIEFVYNIAPDVPLNVYGDPLRISQILINLVNNAVKFTDEGFVIASAKLLKQEGENVELLFEVKDTGIGIKPEQQKALFDSFTQADVSTTRKFGGTGLGLAICKRLTGLMNGKIWVESEYGTGSSFKFTLPLQVQENRKNEQLEMPEDIYKHKVLVGLFNNETKKIITDMLNKFGFRAEFTETTEDIKIKLDVSSAVDGFAFVIIDWPVDEKAEEAELISLIKANKKRKLPTIVTTSAFYENKKLDSLVKKNSIFILHKPFNYSTLYDAIMLSHGHKGTKSTLYKQGSNHFLDKLKKIKDVKILLVEDNEANQMIGTEMLEMAGIKVEIAENGQVAVDTLKVAGKLKSFDLILMDIQMPVLDGFKAARLIREMKDAANVPIVAMTADTVGDALQKYLNAGMVDMIAKPIEPDELYRKVAKWVLKRRGIDSDTGEETTKDQNNTVAKVEDNGKKGIEIPGIDVALGIKRFANKWDFFKRLLERFYDDHVDFEEQLEKALVNNDTETAGRILHSFKGISGTIVATKLYPMTIELEKAFKEKSEKFEELKKETLKELSSILDTLKNSPYLDIN
jgi:PAS domain S-box-containing protein